MADYTIKWEQRVEIEVPCWWRKLLGLPPRKIVEWAPCCVFFEMTQPLENTGLWMVFGKTRDAAFEEV